MLDRRGFLKAIGAASIGPVFASAKQASDANNVQDQAGPDEQKYPQVPRRKLGKTGAEVSVLGLGGDFNFLDKQIVLRKALQYGVNLWDTAHHYGGGNAELGIGKFLRNNPEARKKLFLITKPSSARTPRQVEQRLQTSLKRMHTSYIDLYMGVHGLSRPEQLTTELRQWAQNAKDRGVIRYFGFSVHKNMAACLAAAAEISWVDAILVMYNFRLMQDKKIFAAVEACYQAGLGLIAMKVQGHGQKIPWRGPKHSIETQADKELVQHFLQRGFRIGQAKVKAVLADSRFGSACVGMENVGLLDENIAAVLDRTELTQADRRALDEYARRSCSGYCAGCSCICESGAGGLPCLSDVMRSLMYYNSYGQKGRARRLFEQIPARARAKLATADCRQAESRCPQKLPIGQLVAEAMAKLA